MRTCIKWSRLLRVVVPVLLTLPIAAVATAASSAATTTALSANVLLIGSGASDPSTVAWESALTSEGVPYTEVTLTGNVGNETVTLPELSSGDVGNFAAVILADDPLYFAADQLDPLYAYESSFGVRQVDGYDYPNAAFGLDAATSDPISGPFPSGTTAQLTPAGLAALPALSGPVPMDTGTYGYPATLDPTALGTFTPWLDDASGNVLAGVYQHPATGDAQANVAELVLTFDYSATDLQFELLAPGIINWATDGTHLGLQRNYVEMDIDDTFTPDNAWSTAVHDNDYSDADSLRMDPADVVYAADWSNPTQENDPSARPAGVGSTPFRLDQLFNYGGTVEYQNDELDLPGETAGPDPLLAQFQTTDPTTGKPYSDDFGWLSHTYDTPYLDVGCATQNYIEAELNENTSDAAAAPKASLPSADESGALGTGGLGLTESTDVDNAYGYENPAVFVPGNHSGFADLEPGTPATVDPPDLDEATASPTGGSLTSGEYEYAVTDQFNAEDSTSTDQSQAYVTDGLEGDLNPVQVTGSNGSVSLVWQAICHAANYIVYRAPVSDGTVGSWTEIGTYATPDSAVLPDNSSGDPTSTTNVAGGGEQELTFNDTGATSGTDGSVTYMDTPMPAGWTPPVVENANEAPWEQNPYFVPALEAVGITTVGADASKAYPDPAGDQFGIGTAYTGATYAAGQPFTDGTAQVAPRHPINIFYNAATNAQELDEYNTLYTSTAPDSQCHTTATTTSATTPYTFAQVIDQVVSGMLQNALSNNPEPTYVHQTNLMGQPPYSSILPPADYVPSTTAQSGTDGDGLLYEVLNPLISEYNSYFNANAPIEQLTLGGIGNVLAEQTAWSNEQTANDVSATDANGVVTITNTGTSAIDVPVTVPDGTTLNGAPFGESYGGELSDWVNVAAGASVTLVEPGASLTPPSTTTTTSPTSPAPAPQQNPVIAPATSSTPTVTTAQPTCKFALSSSKLAVASGTVPVHVRTSSAVCSGTVTLESSKVEKVRKGAHTVEHTVTVTLAKRNFANLKPGTHAISLALTSLGRSALAHAARRPVVVTLSVSIRGKPLTKKTVSVR